MCSRRLIAFLCTAAVLATALPAHAWVIFGRLKPGEVQLSSAWPESKVLETMLREHASIGGRFVDSVTGRHFSATYLFHGREVAVQRMINELNRMQLAGTTVELVEDEAFETYDGRRHEVVFYDWKLSIDGTTFVDQNGALFVDQNGALPAGRPPSVTMTVYLGNRLDRTKLRIPKWMQPGPQHVSAAPLVPMGAGPVSAFQALARAARDD